VQKHAASHLHYDFRWDADGVLKSWAVPKGPSLDPTDKRLAMQTEEHPLEYIGFEGVTPEPEYGDGTVIVWDRGTYRNLKADDRGNEIQLEESLERGSLHFWMDGHKLRGGFSLV
jgi:DNA ligase D-like protein (predicted 3'-phosphoesterase)